MLTASPPAPTALGPDGRQVRTYSFEELAGRADALALSLGTRATASALLLACVVVILIGAQSLLGTMQSMNSDLTEMSELLEVSNDGLKMLNTTMDALPPTNQHIGAIVATMEETSKEVETSKTAITDMSGLSGKLNTNLGKIAASTTSMRGSLQDASAGTTKLSGTIDTLNTDIAPLVSTQHQMLLGTRRMRGGLDMMNASLAYTIRILNYIAAPPTGGGMTIRADLPKQTLPPLPGIHANVKPIQVFPRNPWTIYQGP